MSRFASVPVRTQITAVVVLAALLAGGLWWRYSGGMGKHLPAHNAHESEVAATATHEVSVPATSLIEFPAESWKAAGIEVHAAQRAPLVQSVQLTGKIALNEDRVTHVFPLVEGRVQEVKVQFGQLVAAGELLAVVQSKEVGQAMLQLYQDRLQLDFVSKKDRWTQEVTTNTLALIDLIRSDLDIEQVEAKLKDRPLGDYRDQLITAYIKLRKAKLQYERLAPLSRDGSVPGKQLLEAEAERNTARATLQSLVEQISQDAKQAAIVSTQSVKDLETRVAVDETNLEILGFDRKALANINPTKQGESIAHYPIRAPFAGTVISKDITVLESIGPTSQILSIADLSTVWVTTDVFEAHLPLLKQLAGKTILLRSNSWPGKTFEAQVFYTGDIVHESSRTVSMRAVADSQSGALKPGMFVNVELPNLEVQEVLQVPLTAVLDHEGKSFLFVHVSGDKFARHDVDVGRRNHEACEIISGLQPGEQVVTSGGFALKSRMLAELLAE
ncbi:efflux RND transporter periplasmic adaptor subunit [Anatilimnocola sp. NA78]|uniref:efflux RND transporter periplasmic adaptor subunit n=1 Tax=Anatilimnocola sp. NA78 TaxID=3415683 RepID=UPI003CE560A3